MFDYILSLGGTVFVPIIMIVIGLIFRIPWLQAIKAGVTVGIGFVGMGLVIVMAIDSLSPPIKVMIERFGLTLHVFDVGAGPASGVGYATAIGAMIIPVIFLLVKDGRLDGKTSTKHRRAGRYFDTARLRLQLGTLVRSTGCYL